MPVNMRFEIEGDIERLSANVTNKVIRVIGMLPGDVAFHSYFIPE